MEEVTDL